MQFPKLTPLQSRVVACLCTSILLVIIYYSLSPSHFAYAAELDSILNEDHNHHRIALGHNLDLANDIDWGEDDDQLDVDSLAGTAEYQAEFPGVSRQLIGRAPNGFITLMNNMQNMLNVAPGDTNHYMFESASVFGPQGTARTSLPTSIPRADGTTIWRRDDSIRDEDELVGTHELLKRQNGTTSRVVYISANTCLQPSPQPGQTLPAPQLTMYVSYLDDNNTKPGPDKNDGFVTFVEGYANITVNATSNVYVSVVAPTLTNSYTGQWNYAIAASIDASYFYYDNTTSFIWTVDTDSDSALLSTLNLTAQDNSTQTMALRQQWNNTSPPFLMKIYNSTDPRLQGVQNSYCGLSMLDINPVQVQNNITFRGMGQNPKQQFYATGLQPGQTYTAILGYNGVNATETSNNGVIAGGGQLWQPMAFTTKTDGNCKIIQGLSFCDAVAYAVPTNPLNPSLDVQNLTQMYDNLAQALYLNFTYSLDQIQCDTSESQQYSLATNCTQCAKNYKTWLCAVTIPRCEDFSSTKSWLRPRNVGQLFPNRTNITIGEFGTNSSQPQRLLTNSSRNPMIDQDIIPGPYKELLPCQELCHDLVQACPAALQFQCPKSTGYAGGILSQSYGSFDKYNLTNSESMTCNYLGVDWPSLSSGGRIRMTLTGWSAVVGAILCMLLG